MRTLTADELLALCEEGAGLHAIDRSLRVLARALPDRDFEELARLPLGHRDRLLLAVRRATLGETLDARDVCPACSEQVDVRLECSALIAASQSSSTTWRLEHDDYHIRLRVLDSVDAATAARAGDVGTACSVLLSRSIVESQRGGEVEPVEQLPGPVVSAAVESLAAHDPGAELLLDFVCPSCHQSWNNVLDVATFVWAELAAHAGRLIVDVHTLAVAYGWREADILAMSDSRRAAYLALVTA
jgi:hypothetical protein